MNFAKTASAHRVIKLRSNFFCLSRCSTWLGSTGEGPGRGEEGVQAVLEGQGSGREGEKEGDSLSNNIFRLSYRCGLPGQTRRHEMAFESVGGAGFDQPRCPRFRNLFPFEVSFEIGQASTCKVNFSINAYIESIESVEGVQRLRDGEMMWEGRHEEFCKSAQAGASDSCGCSLSCELAGSKCF